MSILEPGLLGLVSFVVELRARLLDWMIDRFGYVKTFAVHVLVWAAGLAAFTYWPF